MSCGRYYQLLLAVVFILVIQNQNFLVVNAINTGFNTMMALPGYIDMQNCAKICFLGLSMNTRISGAKSVAIQQIVCVDISTQHIVMSLLVFLANVQVQWIFHTADFGWTEWTHRSGQGTERRSECIKITIVDE
jgi:hypothetical protein